MDVLKPEIYWIGSRCYRKNPSKNNHKDLGVSSSQNNRRDVRDPYYSSNSDVEGLSRSSSGTAMASLAPYVEEDVMLCDPDAPDETLDYDDKYVVEQLNEGCFLSRCDIPASLFPQIIGSKGTTKKRIETETNTRINVPRQGEKGDIVVRGQSSKDVRNARRRLELIVHQSRMKREPTHFACFPLNCPAIVESTKRFKEQVMKECGMYSKGLDERIFNDPEKAHLTLCVMALFDERERSKAGEILKSIQNQFKKDITKGEPIKLHLKGLEIMNDDPTNVDVLYAKCVLDESQHLQKLADLVARSFIDAGLAKENRGEKVKLHCTVMNTRLKLEAEEADQGFNRNGDNGGRNRPGNRYNLKNRESFDASLILSKFKDFDFGTVEIKEIKLATRHTKGSDGFYKCASSVTL